MQTRNDIYNSIENGVEVLSSSDLLKKARNNEIIREFTALDDYNKIHKSNVIYLEDNKYKDMSEDECLLKVLKKHIKTAK